MLGCFSICPDRSLIHGAKYESLAEYLWLLLVGAIYLVFLGYLAKVVFLVLERTGPLFWASLAGAGAACAMSVILPRYIGVWGIPLSLVGAPGAGDDHFDIGPLLQAPIEVNDATIQPLRRHFFFRFVRNRTFSRSLEHRNPHGGIEESNGAPKLRRMGRPVRRVMLPEAKAPTWRSPEGCPSYRLSICCMRALPRVHGLETGGYGYRGSAQTHVSGCATVGR